MSKTVNTLFKCKCQLLANELSIGNQMYIAESFVMAIAPINIGRNYNGGGLL